MPLEIYTDGGSRGNPGPAAAAVVIRDQQGKPILEAGYFLGKATNNVAEYKGLILALEAAGKIDADDVSIYMDSELIVRQITGEYRVKDATLAQLFERAQRLLLKFDSWRIKHVRREQNKRADALVNKALDAKADVVEIQVGNACPDTRPAPQEQAGLFGTGQAKTSQSPPSSRHKAGPSSQTGGSGDSSAQGDPDALFPVIVRCIHDPRQDACKAGMQQDLEFLFTDAMPGGLCIHAAKAVLDTVLAMRYAASRGETPGPVRARCRLPNCGAEFDIRLAPNR